MIATWSALVHTGNPANPALPAWPRYDGARSTMLLSRASKVASDPGGIRRAALEGVPAYEYNVPVNYHHA